MWAFINKMETKIKIKEHWLQSSTRNPQVTITGLLDPYLYRPDAVPDTHSMVTKALHALWYK